MYALFVLLPFTIAAKARKRGRAFAWWFIASCILGPVVYIYYWLVLRNTPILPEYQIAP